MKYVICMTCYRWKPSVCPYIQRNKPNSKECEWVVLVLVLQQVFSLPLPSSKSLHLSPQTLVLAPPFHLSNSLHIFSGIHVSPSWQMWLLFSQESIFSVLMFIVKLKRNLDQVYLISSVKTGFVWSSFGEKILCQWFRILRRQRAI